MSGIISQTEKLKLSTHPNPPSLTYGKEYYLVLYTPENLRLSSTIFNKSVNLFVGEACMYSDSVTFYSTTSITGTPSAFSPNATISVTGVPSTAVVYKATLKSATPGITISQVGTWRIKRSDESTWATSGQFIGTINLLYSYGSSTNKKLLGNWLFAFKPPSTTLTFIPGVLFNYYYELGD